VAADQAAGGELQPIQRLGDALAAQRRRDAPAVAEAQLAHPGGR
jgi:hypothetical protein